MARKLLDAVQKLEAQEAKKAEEKKWRKEENRTVDKIMSKEGAKDKQISAKVNRNIYNSFTSINKMQGLSNNSALNMLITKYVRDNIALLKDDRSNI